MPNWKDVVMSQLDIDIVDKVGVIDGDIVPYLSRQSEISFKAGIEEARNRLYSPEVLEIADMALKDERKAGIKEVVDTVIFTDITGEVQIKELFLRHESGQAKLKKWGL